MAPTRKFTLSFLYLGNSYTVDKIYDTEAEARQAAQDLAENMDLARVFLNTVNYHPAQEVFGKSLPALCVFKYTNTLDFTGRIEL